MNRERIQQMRDQFAKMPDKAFDMTTWQAPIKVGREGDAGIRRITFQEMQERGFACGSAGCIGGWTELFINQMSRWEERHGLNQHNDERPEYVNAAEYFNLILQEEDNFFLKYPGEPPEGLTWKDWILERMDGVLRENKIYFWRAQMKDFYERHPYPAFPWTVGVQEFWEEAHDALPSSSSVG